MCADVTVIRGKDWAYRCADQDLTYDLDRDLYPFSRMALVLPEGWRCCHDAVTPVLMRNWLNFSASISPYQTALGLFIYSFSRFIYYNLVVKRLVVVLQCKGQTCPKVAKGIHSKPRN